MAATKRKTATRRKTTAAKELDDGVVELAYKGKTYEADVFALEIAIEKVEEAHNATSKHRNWVTKEFFQDVGAAIKEETGLDCTVTMAFQIREKVKAAFADLKKNTS